MRQYLARVAELAGVAFGAGVVTYVTENGLDWSEAGLRGLATAGVVAAYGAVVRYLGEKDRPTVK